MNLENPPKGNRKAESLRTFSGLATVRTQYAEEKRHTKNSVEFLLSHSSSWLDAGRLPVCENALARRWAHK